MSVVLVTGATGFVGRELCQVLARSGHEVRAAVRSLARAPAGVAAIEVGDMGPHTDWSAALAGVDAVVHAAARVHMMNAGSDEHLHEAVNAQGTRRLAMSATVAGVRRMVLLSSIKVNGEGDDGRVYRPDDLPAPQDAYGRSKLAAETFAFEVAAANGLQVVVVRAPLMYGPQVRANFLKLMHWVWRRRPLPFGAIDNSRSLIGLRNICELLRTLVEHPAAAGKVWLASDGEDLSTPMLVRRVAAALGVRPRLVAIPESWLRAGGRLTGASAQVSRLCGSLLVDSSALHTQLGWSPPFTVDEELQRTASWFRNEEAGRVG